MSGYILLHYLSNVKKGEKTFIVCLQVFSLPYADAEALEL